MEFMTLNEILKANGVNDEAISAIAAAMKENKIYTASEENLDIRYGKLKTQHDGVNQQLTEANALIEELKKSNKGNDGLQQKVTDYETKVQQLQAELEQTKLDAAIKVELLVNKAVDVDYLTFKLKNKGEALTLDENGKIKDWDDKLAALKTQFPNQFEASGKKTVVENRLPGNDEEAALTKSDILKKPYAERAKLFEENPEGFRAAMGE
jgi:hypothetical protein